MIIASAAPRLTLGGAVTQFFSGFAELSNRTAQTSEGGVAYWAHIGGFVTGVVIGLVAAQFVRPRQPTYNR